LKICKVNTNTYEINFFKDHPECEAARRIFKNLLSFKKIVKTTSNNKILFIYKNIYLFIGSNGGRIVRIALYNKVDENCCITSIS